MVEMPFNKETEAKTISKGHLEWLIWKNVVFKNFKLNEMTHESAGLPNKSDPKAPFSIATTPRCWGGLHSIPSIAPLYP